MHVVVTYDEHYTVTVFGPYATSQLAHEAAGAAMDWLTCDAAAHVCVAPWLLNQYINEMKTEEA